MGSRNDCLACGAFIQECKMNTRLTEERLARLLKEHEQELLANPGKLYELVMDHAFIDPKTMTVGEIIPASFRSARP
jgi:hypothetical protein